MDEKNLNFANLDLSLLDTLTPAEKELALSILKEYAEKGESKSYNDIILEDYNEAPVDILTFVDDYNYLGNAWHDAQGNSKLYPYWRKELKKLFPTNIDTNVNNIILSGSRGRGKALPNSLNVCTTNGIAQVKDIKVGDYLIDRHGNPTKVLGVFPQGKKEVYQLTFEDGRVALCCKDHLWTYTTKENGKIYKTNNLSMIIDLLQNTSVFIPLNIKDKINFKKDNLKIIDIKSLNYLENMTCFYVDNKEHLFQLANGIVTHNTEIAVLIAAYLLHRILCLKDPIAYFHLKATEKIVFAFMNIKLALAEEIADSKFQNTIKSSPWFLEHGKLEGRTKKVWVPQTYINSNGEEQIAVDIKIGSQADDLIGLPIYYCLDGDTEILTSNGVSKIKNLVDKQIKVPTISDDSNIVLSNICSVKQTAESNIEYEIKLEDNTIIKCTPNHRFRLVDGSYKEAQNLTEDDDILSFTILNRWNNKKEILKIKSIKVNYLEKPKQYYDVINADPYNNFFIKTNSTYICSHNCFFDEVSFQRNQDIEKQKKKANDMIDTAIGGMKTRFVHKGKNPTLLVLASSKRSNKSFLEEHMKKKLVSEKENVYISDGSVWEVKPKGTYSEKTFKIALGNKFLQSMIIPDDDSDDKYIAKGYKIIEAPIDFKADFIDDIDRSLCDFAGISSSSITKYINGAAVNDTLTDRIKNPFTKEILEIGDAPDDDVQYYNFFDISKIDPNLKSKPLFIHLDMSYTGDMTGIAGVFIKGKKPSTNGLDQSKDLFFSLAFSVNIKAPKGRHISFEKNRNFIYWLKEKGFNIKGITSDTFQSYDTGETLRAKGYPYSVLSVDRCDTNKVCVPYQYFRSTIYEKRIEMYNDKILVAELIDLERNMDTGKVDHPDGGCFTGETTVKLVDGRTLNFLELIEEFNAGKQNYVYSINLDTHKIEPKKILKAWKTRENSPLIRITLDNDKSIECTLDHKFMLRNGEYIQAQDLIPGDSLMPLYTKYPEKGGLKEYRLYYEPFEDKWHYEHRQFAEQVFDKKYLVHHIDCNKNNNSPDNLIWMSKEEHYKVHSNNGTGAYSKEALKKKSNAVHEWHLNNKDTAAYSIRAEKTRQSLLQHNLEKYGHNATIDWQKHIKEVEETFGVNWDVLSLSEKNSYGNKLAKLKDETIQQRISESLSKAHTAGKFKNAERALKENNQKNKKLKELFPTIDKDKFFELFNFDYDSIDSYHKGPWNNRYRQKLYDLINHKVKSIEFIDKKADVYDIEVEDNHNFALAAGVFVHNCKDVADATCGAVFNASKHAEEFAYDYGEQAEDILRLNSEEFDNDNLKQLTVNLEQELLAMGKERLHPSDVTALTKTDDYNLYDDIIIL